MRLTLALLTKPRWIIGPHTKPSFRRPMQGQYVNRKIEKSWETWMGEIDEEEENELGQMVPVKERIPMIMVPDLKNCNLKPYVTYSVEKHHEPAVTSKDLFDTFYAPQIQAEMSGTKLENIPTPQTGLLNRVKTIFQKSNKEEDIKKEAAS